MPSPQKNAHIRTVDALVAYLESRHSGLTDYRPDYIEHRGSITLEELQRTWMGIVRCIPANLDHYTKSENITLCGLPLLSVQNGYTHNNIPAISHCQYAVNKTGGDPVVPLTDVFVPTCGYTLVSPLVVGGFVFSQESIEVTRYQKPDGESLDLYQVTATGSTYVSVGGYPSLPNFDIELRSQMRGTLSQTRAAGGYE